MTRKRKFRGKGRYYRRLRERAAHFVLDVTDEIGFDLWHTHFDWPGHSNRGLRHRRLHLEALFHAFRRVLNQAGELERNLQVFCHIAPDSCPEQDALYVHSENANGTPFPYFFPDTEWGVTPPQFLRTFLDDDWEIGVSELDGEHWYSVRPVEDAISSGRGGA